MPNYLLNGQQSTSSHYTLQQLHKLCKHCNSLANITITPQTTSIGDKVGNRLSPCISWSGFTDISGHVLGHLYIITGWWWELLLHLWVSSIESGQFTFFASVSDGIDVCRCLSFHCPSICSFYFQCDAKSAVMHPSFFLSQGDAQYQSQRCHRGNHCCMRNTRETEMFDIFLWLQLTNLWILMVVELFVKLILCGRWMIVLENIVVCTKMHGSIGPDDDNCYKRQEQGWNKKEWITFESWIQCLPSLPMDCPAHRFRQLVYMIIQGSAR